MISQCYNRAHRIERHKLSRCRIPPTAKRVDVKCVWPGKLTTEARSITEYDLGVAA